MSWLLDVNMILASRWITHGDVLDQRIGLHQDQFEQRVRLQPGRKLRKA